MTSLHNLSPLLNGFSFGASLIIAIGSQNAFVLRQGLKREYVFAVCTVCFLCDAILISLGAMGFGALVASSALLLKWTLWGGAAFLFAYGFRSFLSALRPRVLEAGDDNRRIDKPGRVILAALGLSLLNPHVYLDTVLLLGSLAGQYAVDARILFTFGSITASLVWFYGIGYGARVLIPLFRTQVAWRILDVLVGCTMWGIAGSLVWKRLEAG